MKRLRLVGVLLVLVGVVVAPIGARAPHFLRFFVFGDSLSDTGNDFILSSALGAQPALPPSVSPNRTYFNGRFSNGPVAVEYLWGRLNSVPVSLIPPSLADRRVPVPRRGGGRETRHLTRPTNPPQTACARSP